MSRSARDDPERDAAETASVGPLTRSVDLPGRIQSRASSDTRWSPSRGLSLPRTPDRQHGRLGRECIRLRASETELLATIGAFRVIAQRDLQPSPLTFGGCRTKGWLKRARLLSTMRRSVYSS